MCRVATAGRRLQRSHVAIAHSWHYLPDYEACRGVRAGVGFLGISRSEPFNLETTDWTNLHATVAHCRHKFTSEHDRQPCLCVFSVFRFVQNTAALLRKGGISLGQLSRRVGGAP